MVNCIHPIQFVINVNHSLKYNLNHPTYIINHYIHISTYHHINMFKFKSRIFPLLHPPSPFFTALSIAGSADFSAASLAGLLRSTAATSLPHRGWGPQLGRPRAARRSEGCRSRPDRHHGRQQYWFKDGSSSIFVIPSGNLT